MDVSRELLFFFSALGAFNGLLMGLYFFFIAKPKHISNSFLGAFLICLSIRIGKSVFFYFNPELSFIYLQIGLTGCLFIGPFLYFYVNSILHNHKKANKFWKLHIAVLAIVMTCINFIYPFEFNIDIWRPYVILNIYHVWLVYTILAAIAMKDVFVKLISNTSAINKFDFWLISVWLGNTIIWFAYYFSGVMSYILGALLFSFFLYLFVIYLIFNKNKDFIEIKTTKSYENKKINAGEAKILLDRLKTLMASEKLYKNAGLKLNDVAKQLKITPHTLSQLLNDNLKISFPMYLNQYRIEEAKLNIKSQPNLTLESIGYECGFNSKSTFYSVFKKLTQTTPAQYQKSLAQNTQN